MKSNITLISLLIVIVFMSCKKKKNYIPKFKPTVTTSAVSVSSGCTANSGGEVTSNGGASLSAWGVCWGTASNPTLANSFLQNAESSGGFSSSLSGLIPMTTYYIRAYATNFLGTSYGDEFSFTTPFFCIGESYQGGKIAYILQPGDIGYDSNVQHGLIVSPNDYFQQDWGCQGTLLSGADGTAIGTGSQNTIDIMNGCTSQTAASKCGELVLGGYSDWYLPSKDELNKLYINMVALGYSNDCFNCNCLYWSSSEFDANLAWCQNFSTTNCPGYQSALNKGNNGLGAKRYRAVRSF
jgi:hypothetical protein